MITLTCEQCGQPYQAKPYMAAKSARHFCGFACYGKWQTVNRRKPNPTRVSVMCHTCGKSFEKMPSAVAKHNFCGRACFAEWRASRDWSGANNPSWKGGHLEYRGPNWTAQRQAARVRDEHTCQRCGKRGRNLPVHHIRPYRLFDTHLAANDLSNLVTLCPHCHSQAEAEFWRDNADLAKSLGLPNVALPRDCRRCGNAFTATAARTTICDACRTITCHGCGRQFVSDRAAGRNVKYCSLECSRGHRRATAQQYRPRVCVSCGREFSSKHRSARYCSQECHLVRDNPRRKFFARRARAAQA